MPSRPIETSQNKESNRKPLSPHKATQSQHGTRRSSPNSNSSTPQRQLSQKEIKLPSLLGIPAESLTHITSYLDPPSLFNLGLVNKHLHQHVDDDNTWRRAFGYHYLGIAPEGDLKYGILPDQHGIPIEDVNRRSMMLRRVEGTWKKEYVGRWNLRRRWERSRSTTVTHIPHHSPISGLYLMPSPTPTITASSPHSSSANSPLTHNRRTQPAILASSLQYGIVSRSFPLTGQVLRGYLDANGTSNGLGIGNPNQEFSPNITCCAITSEGSGGTAKVIWGFRNGGVAVTVANKVTEVSRPSGAKWARCPVEDEHRGSVDDAVWGCLTGTGGMNIHGGGGGGYFVTGGADGKVKLWEAKRARCLWTGEPDGGPDRLIRDPCVKVGFDVSRGVVVGVMKSGETFVWNGFEVLHLKDGSPTPLNGTTTQATPKKFALPAHSQVVKPSTSSSPSPSTQPTPPVEREVVAVHVEPTHSSGVLSILTVYKNDTHFYRSIIDLTTGYFTQQIYGDPSGGHVASLQPHFAHREDESSFIVVGDSLGCVLVFSWPPPPALYPVSSSSSPLSPLPIVNFPPVRKFEAHSEGAITSLTWTPTVLLTGSSMGIIRAWDSYSFDTIRYFQSPNARPNIGGDWDEVQEVVVRGDLMVGVVGKKVMGWVGGPVGKDRINGGKGKGKQVHRTTSGKGNGLAKWQQQYEMSRDIEESRMEFERENKHIREAFGREREQRSRLNDLGLSEREAVEYVLMLSREEAVEEEQKRQGQQQQVDEGFLVGEFDDIQTPVMRRGDEYFSSTSSRSDIASGRPSGRSFPQVSVPTSNNKVQVSPRLIPEPMEAGFSTSPLSTSAMENGTMQRPGSGSSSLSASSFKSAHSHSHQRRTPPSTDDLNEFPSMSSTPTSVKKSASSASASSVGSPTNSGNGSVRNSASTGAWSTRPGQIRSSPPSLAFTSSSSASPSPSPRRLATIKPSASTNVSLLSAGFAKPAEVPLTASKEGSGTTRGVAGAMSAEDREAEELRFAIELSLAEARSRGEDA